MNDEYIPPYADHSKLIELRSKADILTACGRASENPDDTEALGAVLTAHPNATKLFPEDELRQIIQNSRIQRGDIFVRENIEYRDFTLPQAINARIEELNFEDVYEPLINASPFGVGGLSRLDFLNALFPNGQTGLMLESSKGKSGLPWKTEIGEDIGGAWFLPLPVKVGDDPDELIDKSKASVASWNSATANFSQDCLVLMRDQIIKQELPVKLILKGDRSITVIFAIEAANEAEWRNKCRKLRADIQALGASCPAFRYNWVCPMIHPHFTRLIYLNPV